MVLALSPERRAERLAFLEARQHGVGGSDLPAIFGLVPGRNALDVYYEKTRPIDPDLIEDDTIHQLRGHTLEPMAIAHYWAHTGRKGRATGIVVSHPDYPRVRVRRDFEIFSTSPNLPEGVAGPGTGEVKSPMAFVYRRIIDHGLRESEIVQLQANIAASRHEWGSFCFFNMEDKDGPVMKVDLVADEALGTFLLREGQRFFDEHVAARIPPDPAGWAQLMEHDDAPPIIDLSGEVVAIEDIAYANLLETAIELDDVRREAEKVRKAYYDELLSETEKRGHAKVHVPSIGKATVVTVTRKGSLDADTMANAMMLDRDKVERWLRDWVEYHSVEPGLMDELSFEEIGEMLFECVVDLEQFRKPGSTSRHVRTTRSRDV